jgi:hypothetical protein
MRFRSTFGPVTVAEDVLVSDEKSMCHGVVRMVGMAARAVMW